MWSKYLGKLLQWYNYIEPMWLLCIYSYQLLVLCFVNSSWNICQNKSIILTCYNFSIFANNCKRSSRFCWVLASQCNIKNYWVFLLRQNNVSSASCKLVKYSSYQSANYRNTTWLYQKYCWARDGCDIQLWEGGWGPGEGIWWRRLCGFSLLLYGKCLNLILKCITLVLCQKVI